MVSRSASVRLDFGFARIERGDGLKVRFPPSTYGDADGLTNADAGTQYRVGGALMTVASVQGDVITFAPPHDFNREFCGGSDEVRRVRFSERSRSGGCHDAGLPAGLLLRG